MSAFEIRRRRFIGSLLAGLAGPSLLPAQSPPPGGEVPWLSEVQRPTQAPPADAPRLSPLLVDENGRPITTLDQWERRREAIRRKWLEFLKPLPLQRQQAPAIEVVSEERVGSVVRQLVRYESEPRQKTEAYLLKPREPARKCPGAVVLHSTTNDTIRQPAGVAGAPEKAFGLKLAERGWVAVCPRNFLWGDEGKIETRRPVEDLRARHPGSKGMAKMLHDAMVAVDLLATMPEVDPGRLGAVGHSLGAKEVLYLAAFDPRVRVAVSSEGGVGTRFSNWDAPWYLGDEILAPDFAAEHHELLALVAPRPFLLLGGDSADGDRSWPFIEAVLPVYHLYGPSAPVGLFNHKRGHSVPPEAERRIYEWLEAYGV